MPVDIDLRPLWQPSRERVDSANLTRFMLEANRRYGLSLEGYDAVYDWSLAEMPAFWKLFWDFAEMIGERSGAALVRPNEMPGAKFFPDARVNYAENMLRQDDGGDALVFRAEDKVERRLSWKDLNALVSRMQQALVEEGVGEGDRVAGFMPNMPETLAAMLATASLGAIWSSCSPDFGVNGVLDRFGQIGPKVLFCPDGYYYNGKTIDVRPRVKEFVAGLSSVQRVVTVPLIGDGQGPQGLTGAMSLEEWIGPFAAKPLTYRRVPFNTPLFIMFSSGTTGRPKCIVHGVGGVLLQHFKEYKLQCDVKWGDRVFYFTTCGWMMWNWLASGIGCGATLLLYDGSPFYPDGNVLWDYAQAERCTLFGTSAKYIDSLAKTGIKPMATHDLADLRTVASTGSPLMAEGFDYIYRDVKADVCLSSIAGGTDILGCFMGGDPIGPVWRGEIQKRHLAMAVEVFDDSGNSVIGEKGELVCTKPFPSMPIEFWDDPSGERYRAAYFDRYPNVWCHGDFVELTEHGGIVVYGRSDATLNPGGVRIGTAEIYRQVERIPEVLETLVIGQDWGGDVRVILFLRLRDGVSLDESLIKAVKTRIRQGCTPRHVPAKVIAVADIPRTKSGKVVELAVRDVVHGRQVKNKEALANPEALDLYGDLADLKI
ncbi:MAG: acetoacetate--CoA ligase [Rhodospirillales bacterium]|nr:acetoacetate--CoA ligase [Rhodospirillales bacterium]